MACLWTRKDTRGQFGTLHLAPSSVNPIKSLVFIARRCTLRKLPRPRLPLLRRPETQPRLFDPDEPTPLYSRVSLGAFTLLALLLIGLGTIRSAAATRLDSFTIDEAYHIAAGVTYVRDADFRVNPEHPPLVKLWVGSVIAATGFNLKPLRQFTDKPDERAFAQDLVYRANDPDSVQRRARAAMYALNGLLLLALAFALRREFNSVVGLGTLLMLLIDPTIAAHMPVVMTDLPVALLSATSLVLAARAFQTWRWPDVAACSASLGVALTAKHSAPVVLLIVMIVGVCASILGPHRLPVRLILIASRRLPFWPQVLSRFSGLPTCSAIRKPHRAMNRLIARSLTKSRTSIIRAITRCFV